jgi:hypothetical protein
MGKPYARPPHVSFVLVLGILAMIPPFYRTIPHNYLRTSYSRVSDNIRIS